MNRGEHAAAAMDLESWHADVDDAFLSKLRRGIDRAYRRISGDIPEALIPDMEYIQIFGDETQTTLGRTLANTDDEYVLTFGAVGLSGAQPIVIDGTWDGVMHLEITYGDTTIRRRCREFWEHKVAGAYLNHYLVSLDRPINFSGQTGLSFRLFQPRFYPKSDVTKVLDARLFDSNRALIQPLPDGFIRLSQFEDFKGETTGVPQAMCRNAREQIPAPVKAPSVTNAPVSNWIDGQEAPGTFKYRYTYVWGKRSTERQSPRGSYDPMWESAPSPESAAITVAAVGSDAVRVDTTNIAWQLDFDPNPTATRSGRSGLRKRIYRARTATTASGTAESQVEAPGVYFFLAEIADDDTTYTDDGSQIPEYDRRLPESAGYWAWSFAPHQNDTYEMDLRVLRRPTALQVDTDSPNIDPQYEHALTTLIRKELAAISDDQTKVQTLEGDYLAFVATFRAEAGNSSAYVPPKPWLPDLTQRPLYYGPYRNNP
jgi:hypothetical protein